MSKYRLGWDAGAGAQIEVFSPRRAKGLHQLKYTSPLRPTIRMPVTDRGMPTRGDLLVVRNEYQGAADVFEGRVRSGATRKKVPVRKDDQFEKLRSAGNLLFKLALMPGGLGIIRSDLRGEGLFLEIGVDEELMEYPWDLLHDGDGFLALKHKVGLFVNAAEGSSPPARESMRFNERAVRELRVLVICASDPQPRDGLELPEDEWHLPAAEHEANAIAKAVKGRVTVLRGEDATLTKVNNALSDHFDIVHFIGHATTHTKKDRAAIVLHDLNLTSGSIKGLFSAEAPTLCFINSCHSTTTTEVDGANREFGVGRAFLEGGAYLIGTRWRVSDGGASMFAEQFYKALVNNQTPIGEAVRVARAACHKRDARDPTWASYRYYGDPRVYFGRS